MKTLIVGRTSTGKDTLKEFLEKTYGWNFVKSTTTRPPRNENEDTHVFISTEEAANIPDEDKVARTVINGHEYFATRQQVTDADGYIIDPIGVKMLLKNMPEEWFTIIYMSPSDTEVQKEMAIKRSDDPEKELSIFNARSSDENAQFTEFEEIMRTGRKLADNCDTIIEFKNNYKKSEIEDFGIAIELRRRFHERICTVINDLVDFDIFNHDNNGNPIVTMAGNHEIALPVDALGECLYEDGALRMLGEMMRQWLILPSENRTDLP